ncbi:DUF3304 domain-containing protein [Pseudoalteromonas sp.]|uniref:DUF3304 domain-containing protein n=1 Tax=Pseudoalteromonas sp. TaxID=53249 RepID=UPI0030031456
MTMIKNIGLTLLAATTVLGCQLITPVKLQVNGLEFENVGTSAMTNVQLKVGPTGNQVSCSLIEPQNSCGTGFPSKWYSGEDLTVNWQQDGRSYTQQLVLEYAQFDDSAKHYRVIVKLSSAGEINAEILPFTL